MSLYRLRFAAYRAITIEAPTRDDAVMLGQARMREGGVQWPTWTFLEALPAADAALIGSTPREQDRRRPRDMGSRTEADAAAWESAHGYEEDM